VSSDDDLDDPRLIEVLGRLSRMSVEDYYNPYRMFDWPDSLPTDRLWMTPELLSIHNTPVAGELSEEQIIQLSIWESLNFYSLNVHGIRELLTEVVARVQMPGFEIPSDFLHMFIGEENEHMWFFAEFCRRYGRKLYYFPQITSTEPSRPEVENFLVFARILVFEEIVDHYNRVMADDESLHETIRHINRIHHRDESRHIAFGHELASLLYSRLRSQVSPGELARISDYMQEYVDYCLRGFYSLDAYYDAGIADPLGLRARLMAEPGRKAAEQAIARKPLSFLRKIGVLEEATT
jgi:hypothetical protein